MADARTIAFVERLAWVLIYGGLFAVVLGIATARTGEESMVWGYSLLSVGGVATVAGVVLIWVRSRMRGPGER